MGLAASACSTGHRLYPSTPSSTADAGRAKRRVDLVLVWCLDRAFRSVLDAAQTLERVRACGVGLRSYQEPWLDATSPFGEALYYITVGYAQSETRHSARARKGGDGQGVHIGRPPVTARVGFAEQWVAVRAEVEAGRISRSEAARRLDCGYATLLRLLRPHSSDTACEDSTNVTRPSCTSTSSTNQPVSIQARHWTWLLSGLISFAHHARCSRADAGNEPPRSRSMSANVRATSLAP